MGYAQGGGLTDAGRAARERIRLEACGSGSGISGNIVAATLIRGMSGRGHAVLEVFRTPPTLDDALAAEGR